MRDTDQEYRVSYFGDEIEDLLAVSLGAHEEVHRCTKITLYTSLPVELPESLKKLTKTSYP